MFHFIPETKLIPGPHLIIGPILILGPTPLHFIVTLLLLFILLELCLVRFSCYFCLVCWGFVFDSFFSSFRSLSSHLVYSPPRPSPPGPTAAALAPRQ